MVKVRAEVDGTEVGLLVGSHVECYDVGEGNVVHVAWGIGACLKFGFLLSIVWDCT